MYIEECIKKEIFGSFQRNKLPGSLTDYNCELCIEEYQQGPISEQVKYFRFTPRSGVKADPFTILIDSISKPKNLIYSYRIYQNEQERGMDAKIVIGDRVEFKMQTTNSVHLQQLEGPDSDGEVVFHELDERMLMANNLQLNESGDDDDDSNGSKCVQPTEVAKGDIKTVLMHYFHVDENRFSKLKDIKSYLRDKGHKISENNLKIMLGEICKTNVPDKKVGFVLKDHFFQQEEYDRRNPKKRLKME